MVSGLSGFIIDRVVVMSPVVLLLLSIPTTEKPTLPSRLGNKNKLDGMGLEKNYEVRE